MPICFAESGSFQSRNSAIFLLNNHKIPQAKNGLRDIFAIFAGGTVNGKKETVGTGSEIDLKTNLSGVTH
jgi:hypothetical protein